MRTVPRRSVTVACCDLMKRCNKVGLDSPRQRWSLTASIGIVVTPRGAKPFPNYKAKEGHVFHTYPTTKSEQAVPSGADKPTK